MIGKRGRKTSDNLEMVNLVQFLFGGKELASIYWTWQSGECPWMGWPGVLISVSLEHTRHAAFALVTASVLPSESTS